MGEAKRRENQGLPPRQNKFKRDQSPRIVSWLPFTERQREQFYALTSRGAWVGIAGLVLLWVVVRFIGPAAGWWTLADAR